MCVAHLLARNVLGQFDVDGTRSLLLGDAECLTYADRDGLPVDDLLCELRERSHHVHDVDDLKPSLLARFNGFLACDHQHGHGAELRIGRGRHEIGRAGPERRQAHPRLAGQAPVCRRHEASSLLVAGEHELDARFPYRLEQIELFLAGNPEDVLDTFVLERSNEKIGCFAGHRRITSTMVGG